MAVRSAKMTDAQVRALGVLAEGKTIYPYNGVSRATAFALVRMGAAVWEVEPHVVVVRSSKPGSKSRSQLEWALRRA